MKNQSDETMSAALVTWYQNNHRKLPWRETKDPYRIWLSEVMCQQTQVATVIPYYLRFLDVFPTIETLAKADEEVVYKLWEGLGYYSRAKRLMLCAKVITEQYQGKFPRDYQQIMKLPGIGPYTGGAILSIAFDMKVPAIDGNVMRVYARYKGIDADVNRPGAYKNFEAYVREDLHESISDFNQGLMELGATICTPTSPKCAECPIQSHCYASLKGLQSSLPVKKKKPAKKHKNIVVLLIEHEGRFMLEKRQPEGLLANLWGLPSIEIVDSLEWTKIKAHTKDYYGIDIEPLNKLNEKKHVFTHLVWDMTLYHCVTAQEVAIEDPQVVWVTRKNFEKYALPTAFLKLLG